MDRVRDKDRRSEPGRRSEPNTVLNLMSTTNGKKSVRSNLVADWLASSCAKKPLGAEKLAAE